MEGLDFVAAVLGIVEGVTEFVPVSSTGHLILAGQWLAFPEEKAPAFEIFIQLGAVFAVVWYYRATLWDLLRGLPSDPAARAFAAKILLAFVPAAVVGLLFHDRIVALLFGPIPVALALAAGGVALIAIDRPRATPAATRDVASVGWGQAFAVGCVQVLALWPGMSRSGATILGGLLAGLSRTAALEFSFFLAIPTLGAASIFALYKDRALLHAGDVTIFAIGLVVSFVVSLAVIAGLLGWVQKHDLRVFGWYRLVLAAIVLVVALR